MDKNEKILRYSMQVGYLRLLLHEELLSYDGHAVSLW